LEVGIQMCDEINGSGGDGGDSDDDGAICDGGTVSRLRWKELRKRQSRWRQGLFSTMFSLS
jgi:hypothetical protein